jgi:peptidoglycan/LPS O-acetylase OafA/YrhL
VTAPPHPSSVARGAHLGYRPALDGLRAFAVVAVMLYHGGVARAQGGFLGVDVFFVLSGFLITSLLVQEWRRTGRIDLLGFWTRRARRLLPAIFLVLLAVAAYSALDRGDHALASRGDALATLGYVSNWWFMSTDQSYFARFLEPSALKHTWSLAIEEQFYLVFPLLVAGWFGRARLGERGFRVVLLVAALGSAALMAAIHDPGVDPSRVYYGTDTRLQALLLGAALALAPALTSPSAPLHTSLLGRVVRLRVAGPLAWAAFAGLVVMVVQAREQAPWMYRGGFLLAAVLSAVAIAAVSRDPRCSLARLLAWRPVVAVGVVSYGLYLWHWPVYVVLTEERTGLTGPWLLAVRVLVTGVLAALSYRLVEEPIRTQRFQRRFTRTQWVRTATAVTVAVAASTLVVPAGAASTGLAEPTSAGARPEPVPDAEGRIVEAFLLGDSQSLALRTYYGNRVDGLAVGGSTGLGCGTLLPERHVDAQTVPNPPGCDEWQLQWIEEVAAARPDLVVLMLGLGELYDRQLERGVVEFGTPEHREWLHEEIDRRREVVRPYTDRFALTTVLCMSIRSEAADPHASLGSDPERLTWLNGVIEEYGEEHPRVPVLDLHGTVCADGYQEEVDGVELRDDGLHLNERGAALVWEQLGPELLAAVG